MTSSMQSLVVRSVRENPLYFLESTDRWQVTIGLFPKNITGIFFRKMMFNLQRSTLTFTFETIWEPPIYQNIIGAYREYMGTQHSKSLGSEIQLKEAKGQLTITLDIPSKTGKKVVDAFFQKLELYQDSKGVSVLKFDVPVLLEPSEISIEEPVDEEIGCDYAELNFESIPTEVNIKRILQRVSSEAVLLEEPSEPFVKEPMYEEIVSDDRGVEYSSIPPEVNMETHPSKRALQRPKFKLLAEQAMRFLPNLFAKCRFRRIFVKNHIYEEIKKGKT